MNKLILAGTALVAFSPGAFAAPTGDAVIIWNANAGVAATKACIAPRTTSMTSTSIAMKAGAAGTVVAKK